MSRAEAAGDMAVIRGKVTQSHSVHYVPKIRERFNLLYLVQILTDLPIFFSARKSVKFAPKLI